MNDNNEVAGKVLSAIELLVGSMTQMSQQMTQQNQQTQELLRALVGTVKSEKASLDRPAQASGGDSVEGAEPRGEKNEGEDSSSAQRVEEPTAVLKRNAGAATAQSGRGTDTRATGDGFTLPPPKQPRYISRPVSQTDTPVTPLGGSRREGWSRTPGAPLIASRGGQPSHPPLAAFMSSSTR